ncbi:hypothetical protein D9M70_518080 [compost metagenome]
MVYLHAVGHGGVHAGLQHCVGAGLGEFLRYVQGAGGSAEVADGFGGHADAERRHHVIEEAVVVIRGEQHHQLRREGLDAGAGVGHDGIDFSEYIRRRVDMAHQRCVGQALHQGTHLRPPCSPAAAG